MDESLPDFGGKIVLVYTSDIGPKGDNYAYLLSPAFETIGGRLFLVGRSPSEATLTVGVPWDCVRRYMVASSMADYRRLTNPPSTKPPGEET